MKFAAQYRLERGVSIDANWKNFNNLRRIVKRLQTWKPGYRLVRCSLELLVLKFEFKAKETVKIRNMLNERRHLPISSFLSHPSHPTMVDRTFIAGNYLEVSQEWKEQHAVESNKIWSIRWIWKAR